MVLKRDSEGLRWPWATNTHAGQYWGSSSGLPGLMCMEKHFCVLIPHSTMSTHYWLHWMLHRMTCRILISNSLPTFHAEKLNWESTVFSTFTLLTKQSKCHFTSKWMDQVSPTPAFQLTVPGIMSWSQLCHRSCLCLIGWTEQGTRYRFNRHRNNAVCCQKNRTGMLGGFSFFQEEWKHSIQYFSKFEGF